MGIVATSVGGVTILTGLLMMASPDSCHPENQSEECQKGKEENSNRGSPVVLGGIGLVTGGILLTIFGGEKKNSDSLLQPKEGWYVGVSSEQNLPLLNITWISP